MFRPLRNAFARLVGSTFAPPVRSSVARHNPNRFRPMLEACEDRTVPSTVILEAIAHATEGLGGGAFQFSRSGDTSQAITVNFTVGGTASSSDYSSFGTSVYFSAFAETAWAYVVPDDDSEAEPTELVTVEITSGTGYLIGSPSLAAVLIYDNETPVVSVENIADAVEGGPNGTFLFTRIGDLSSTITVNFTVGGTATSGTDYTSIGTSVVLNGGYSTVEKTVATIDDNSYDADETVTVTIASGTGYTIGAEDEAEVKIQDSASLTFTLEGTAGGIKYDIPWNDVDPEEESQSLPLSNFVINVGTQSFTPSTSNFTVSPTAEFEYGEFVGITFAIDTSGVGGFGYSALAMAGGLTLEAIQNGTNQLFQVAAPVKEPALVVEFNTYASTATNHTLRVWWKLNDDTDILIQIPIAGSTTAGAVRDTVFSVLQDNGLNVTATGDTRLVVKGTAKGKLKELRFAVINPPMEWAGPSFASRVETATITPKFFVQDVEYTKP